MMAAACATGHRSRERRPVKRYKGMFLALARTKGRGHRLRMARATGGGTHLAASAADSETLGPCWSPDRRGDRGPRGTASGGELEEEEKRLPVSYYTRRNII